MIQTLGEGAFGKVKLAADIQTKVMYAIKILNRKKLKSMKISCGKTGYDLVLTELAILQTLQHPNILWLHEIIDSPKKEHLYLVTEYHINGSVNDLIKTANAKYEE